MTELLPCPFCGGEAETLTAERTDGYIFWVMCHDCCSCGDGYDTEAEAIAAWNTRAVMGYEDARIMLDELGLTERTCHIEYPYYGDAPVINGQPRCSECKTKFAVGMFPNYCPNCGAKVVSE